MSSHHPSKPQQSMLYQSNSTGTSKGIRTSVIVPIPSGLKIVPISVSKKPEKASTMQSSLQRQKMPSLMLSTESLKPRQSANSSTMMIKTENGEYRLLRFDSKMQSILSAGQMVSSINPPGQHRIESKALALPPLTQIKETPIPLPDISQGRVQRFLSKVVEIGRQNEEIRILAQGLANGSIGPEEFCRRYQCFVNYQITPSFVELLKAQLPTFQESLIDQTDASEPPDEDENVNDVTTMSGIDLQEEQQNNDSPSEHIGTKIRSCKDKFLLHLPALKKRIQAIAARHGLEPPDNDVAAIVSHAAEAHLKTIVEKLSVIVEHRRDTVAQDPRYEVSKDVRGQINFLNSLAKAEERRHEESHREMLMRAARAKTKPDDPEQFRLKRKAEEMQRVETEAIRKRNANQTALNAIGPRKKPKLDGSGEGSVTEKEIKISPRVNHVTMRDMIFFLEHEKDTQRSSILYKTYLK